MMSATLAGAAEDSCSVLAARFAELIEMGPMRYLARWRIQLAARRLADGDAKVAAFGAEVGYGSEVAFSRAFRRLTGMAPAEWRRRASRPHFVAEHTPTLRMRHAAFPSREIANRLQTAPLKPAAAGVKDVAFQ